MMQAYTFLKAARSNGGLERGCFATVSGGPQCRIKAGCQTYCLAFTDSLSLPQHVRGTAAPLLIGEKLANSPRSTVAKMVVRGHFLAAVLIILQHSKQIPPNSVLLQAKAYQCHKY